MATLVLAIRLALHDRGIWITGDNLAWGGAFTIDYNAEAPFYGCFSSNHPDQARPYFEPILAYAKEHGGADAAHPRRRCPPDQ